MTLFINLTAGPGVGKSTIAAKTFALMKERGMHVELITEYVKQWAWEQRTPVNADQFFLFGQQTRRESLLAGKVDYVITDAPSILTAYYTQLFGEPSTAALFRSMALEFRRMMEAEGHKFLYVWLQRYKPYDPRGRFQNEEQARQIDQDLSSFLESMKIPMFSVAGDPSAAEKVIEKAVSYGSST